MSIQVKTGAAILLVLLIGAGLYVLATHPASPAESTTQGANQQDTTSVTSGPDMSDATLLRDSAAIDANLDGLSSDTASVDEDLSVQ